MSCNDDVMSGPGVQQGISVNEHLRKSIFEHLFVEQDTDCSGHISYDVDWGDPGGPEEN